MQVDGTGDAINPTPDGPKGIALMVRGSRRGYLAASWEAGFGLCNPLWMVVEG